MSHMPDKSIKSDTKQKEADNPRSDCLDDLWAQLISAMLLGALEIWEGEDRGRDERNLC